MFKIKILITVIFFSLITFAQGNDKLISTAKNIFELSTSSEYKSAAKFFIYSDKNTSAYERVINPDNKNEFRTVKKICKKIKGLLKISSSYNFGEVKNQNNITTVTVNFLSTGQNLNFVMKFVKFKNEYKLLSFK